MIKIIAGEFRSRRLESPPGIEGQRPYLARIKESVFSLLRGWFEEARVLDLFAGVGTVGLEAVSRGASSVLLVEQDKQAFNALEANIEALDCGDRAIAMHGDALAQTCLLRAPRPVDIVFVDPPFAMMVDEDQRGRVLEQVERCRAVMGETGFVVLRTPRDPVGDDAYTIPGLAGPEVHRYGADNWVLLYSPEPSDRGPGEA